MVVDPSTPTTPTKRRRTENTLCQQLVASSTMSTASPERVGTGAAGSPFPTQLGNEWPAESSSAAAARAAEALVDKYARTPTLDMNMDKDNLEDTPRLQQARRSQS
ncbi:hypothetical protein EDD21DRAFT_416740 [Dissophora ornata]|nr:hypothetical protein EDD21DRAFT_416740 [Dissophora ornata]